MNSADPAQRIQAEMRAVIGAFLSEAQKDLQPLALSRAVAAIREVFPDLVISDAELSDAITGEALTAGVNIEFDLLRTPKALQRRTLRPRDDKSGAGD